MEKEEKPVILEFHDGPHLLTAEEKVKIRERAMELARDIQTRALIGEFHMTSLLFVGPTLEWCMARAAAEVCNKETVFTKHDHRCIDWPKCPGTWSHDPYPSYFQVDEEEYQHSHDCPVCGKQNTAVAH